MQFMKSLVRSLGTPILCAGAILVMAGTAEAVPTVYPTGTVLYKPDKAYNGYLLLGDKSPRLVDMNGNLVKEWIGYEGMPNKALPGGQMITSTGSWKDGQQDMLTLVQLDFNGNKMWEFRNWQQVPAIDGQPQADAKTWIARQHHDFQRKTTPVYFTPGQGDGKDQPTLILGHTNEKKDFRAKAISCSSTTVALPVTVLPTPAPPSLAFTT